jgi:hypothetical protein
MTNKSIEHQTISELVDLLKEAVTMSSNNGAPILFDANANNPLGIDFSNPVFVQTLETIASLYTINSEGNKEFNASNQEIQALLIAELMQKFVAVRQNKLQEWATNPWLQGLLYGKNDKGEENSSSN